MPLLPLKPMAQSRRGVTQVREAPHQQQLIKHGLTPVFDFFQQTTQVFTWVVCYMANKKLKNL
jgi:hypothetical protein